jgi:hypothetical protein
MKILRASTHVEEGTIELRLNGHVIGMPMTLYEKEIGRGDYQLEWKVEGKPYSAFRITVSSPVVAEFHLFRKLDGTGKSLGDYRFSI